MRVFFSHSSSDKPLLREISGYLPRWISAWIDEDELLIGAGLERSLREAIDVESDYLVLFLRRSTIESEWVRKEVAWAMEREAAINRVFVVVVLLDDARDELDQLGLGDRLHIRLENHDRNGVESLAKTLTNHLGAWLSEIAGAGSPRPAGGNADPDDFLSSLEAAMRAIPEEWRGEIDATLGRPFLQSLRSGQIGQVPLTPDLYYQRILQDMTVAGAGWTVLAVSTLTSKLWSHDTDQARYASRNLLAVDRGAVLSRIFVVSDGAQVQFRSTIQKQEDAGIRVRIGTSSMFADLPDLEDFVLFRSPEKTRAYVARPTVDGSRRIASGRLMLAADDLGRLDSMFAAAWNLAAEPRSAFATPVARDRNGHAAHRPPGLGMVSIPLAKPVITCEEAASARGIPLANELKTLLLQTSRGLVAAHLPGDGVLSLRKVKHRLESAEAYLADPEDLLELGLSAGTVSAVLDPVWSLPHLISRRLLNLTEVMTNNGSRVGYFSFDPALLTEAKDVVVDDFEK